MLHHNVLIMFYVLFNIVLLLSCLVSWLPGWNKYLLTYCLGLNPGSPYTVLAKSWATSNSNPLSACCIQWLCQEILFEAVAHGFWVETLVGLASHLPEAEWNCKHCLKILNAEMIKIRKFCTIPLQFLTNVFHGGAKQHFRGLASKLIPGRHWL